MKRINRVLFSLAVLCLLPSAAQAGGDGPAKLDQFQMLDKPRWSPDAARIALSDENGRGVHVFDLRTEKLQTLTDTPSSGYMVRWSPDGRRLAFKLLLEVEGGELPLQVPAIFDFDTQQLTRLTNPVAQAGVPSFAQDGRVAFTVGEYLIVLDAAGKPLARWPIGHYANLAPISPDGAWVAFNDDDDGIWLLEVQSGRLERLTESGSWFNPQWSPDGSKLLLSGLTGELASVEPAKRRFFALGRASSAEWMPDSETIVVSSSPEPEATGPVNSDLELVRFDGSSRRLLTPTEKVSELSPAISPDGGRLAYRQEGVGLMLGALELRRSPGGEVGLALSEAQPMLGGLRDWTRFEERSPAPVPRSGTKATTSEIENVTYLHQLYDTADNYNGGWSCGPTSSMMTIAFRGLLPQHDMTCSGPSSHVSHWGWYISNVYTKGRTFDIRAYNADGGYWPGGFGFIWQNDCEDTKGHQAEYLRHHGVSSSVDWSPSWSKLQTEVDNKQPFVILTSITSSGHYKVVTGYFTAQHTFILNDPYGNKARGYPNYYGKRVFYDWPGYSNGYPNVNTVHCFIWSRYTAAPTTGTLKGSVFKQPNTSAVLSGATVKAVGPETKSATTNSAGAYSMSLKSGTYTVTVSKTGFKTETLSGKAVPAGGSLTLNVGLYDATVGNFRGVIYEYVPANPTDTSKRITGAQISVDGGAWETLGSTVSSFNKSLPAGNHEIAAKKTGYVQNSSTRTVVAGQDTWGSIGLTPVGAVVPKPIVHIDSPLNSAQLESATVAVAGSIENATGVSKVVVKRAGQQVAEGTVAGGHFSVEVTVAPGSNEIEVSATNTGGTGSAKVTVQFKTGVCGVVQEPAAVEGSPGTPIAGATVDLLAGTSPCADAAQSKSSDASGRFCFDAAPTSPESPYQLRVKASGHMTFFQDVAIGVEERESVTVELIRGEDPVPAIVVESPMPGEDGKLHVAEPTVSISGVIRGMNATAVTLGGAPVTLDGDGFSAPGLALEPGENTFSFSATGECGKSASLDVVVVREVTDVPGSPDAGAVPPGQTAEVSADGGCGCVAGADGFALLGLVGLLGLRRRRRG